MSDADNEEGAGAVLQRWGAGMWMECPRCHARAEVPIEAAWGGLHGILPESRLVPEGWADVSIIPPDSAPMGWGGGLLCWACVVALQAWVRMGAIQFQPQSGAASPHGPNSG